MRNKIFKMSISTLALVLLLDNTLSPVTAGPVAQAYKAGFCTGKGQYKNLKEDRYTDPEQVGSQPCDALESGRRPVQPLTSTFLPPTISPSFSSLDL